MKPVDGVGVVSSILGGTLIYAGIRGFSMLSILQNLVTGKPITTGVSVTNPLSTPGTTTADVTDSNGVGAVPPGGNQATAMELASSTYGWEGADWVALQKLWNRESNFNNHAKNASSGAYGIPQALPYTKMPKAAWPESAGGSSDASAQIMWGLTYIKGRYGNPQIAWAHETANSWY
jgi:resuscitation-promoting factor RpfB